MHFACYYFDVRAECDFVAKEFPVVRCLWHAQGHYCYCYMKLRHVSGVLFFSVK